MFSLFPQSPLFDGFSPEEPERLFDRCACEIRPVGAGDIIALEGSQCHSLLLLAEGTAYCEIPVPIGEPLPVERLKGPGVIAPALLYAPDNRFPVHWVAESPGVIVSVKQEEWTGLMLRERRLLENFLRLVSDAVKPLSDKAVYRTFKTIKGKFSRYLLDRAAEAASDTFRLELTQREMAELFGVTRPALARAIGEMSAEGSIYVERKQVQILFPEKLKQYVG